MQVQVCKVKEIVCCAVVPWRVVGLCVDQGGHTVALNLVSMSCRYAEEFRQFKGTLSKSVPCPCCSHDEKFPHCAREPRSDEVLDVHRLGA